MARKLALLVGVAAIDTGIKELRGIVDNVNERVQCLAVSIIAHDQEHNDCSRALTLVQALPLTMQRTFLIRFFQYFGAIGIDAKGGKVRHIDPKSNNYHKPDLAGAKANNWYEPFDASGKKADWYEGPNPRAFEPNTLGDFGNEIINISDRLMKKLDQTRDNGSGQEVPVFGLSADERKLAVSAIDTLKKIGLGVMAREEITKLAPLVDLGERLQKVATEAGQPQNEAEQQALETVGEHTADEDGARGLVQPEAKPQPERSAA